MPFLNFMERAIEVEMAAHPKLQTLVSLTFERKEAGDLAQGISELLAPDARETAELRVDYPQGFTVFWKLREGDSRFFLAHPEKEAWVATLALSRDHMQSIHSVLGAETTALAVDLSTLAPISKMSNLEVRVKVKS